MAATVGVIGVGNMGSALVKGWLRAGISDLLIWDAYRPAVDGLLEWCSAVEAAGPVAASSLEELAESADTIVVVVKPKDAKALLSSLNGLLRAEHTVVSAMAGLTLEWLREALGPGPVLLRAMPNLAVELGAGAVAIAVEEGSDPATVERMLTLFDRLGLAEVMPEESFDVFTAVSGSSPAFFALTIEGLEDGAVAAGISRADARRLVRGAALETARRLAEGSDSPAELREGLLSSGDMPARSLKLLEERELSAAFRAAVAAAMERSQEMRKA